MTKADLLDRCGRVLFGDLYVADVSFLLRVDKTTVNKWRRGKSDIPPGVWLSLLDEVNRRRDSIEILLVILRREISSK